MYRLPAHKLRQLRDILSSKYGIFIDDSKLNGIYKKKIESLMKKFNYKNLAEFLEDINSNKNSILLQELVNTITVNETYFFREKYQFEILVKNIIPEIDSIRPINETINILSAPCSTGEEIYSIAIYILEEANFLKKRDFMLLGIDIDSNAISKAKSGVYPERSVSKLPPLIIQKYFKKIEKNYYLKDVVRKAVNFRTVNILDKYKMGKLGKFDIIFCRNMLIYFNEENRKKVLSIFYKIMKPNSYLFLGHAEKVPENFQLFKKVKVDNIYFYKKE